MSTISHAIRRQPGGIADASQGEIIAAPISRAVILTGLSRAGIYRGAAAGNIVLIKNGRSTLVLMASARRYLASLPTATIKPSSV